MKTNKRIIAAAILSVITWNAGAADFGIGLSAYAVPNAEGETLDVPITPFAKTENISVELPIFPLAGTFGLNVSYNIAGTWIGAGLIQATGGTINQSTDQDPFYTTPEGNLALFFVEKRLRRAAFNNIKTEPYIRLGYRAGKLKGDNQLSGGIQRTVSIDDSGIFLQVGFYAFN